ncbi:MAG: pentapeptide repeat-containing protein [Candidatus Eremiobacteraeota bacterium]|nr:pentapeptide repeat-containing protein [Candidatus Eremiobacteraeota bacterium]
MVFLAVLLAALIAPPLHFCMGCSFAGAQLGSSDFSNVTYVGTNFAGAQLGGSSFRGARLVATNFQGADLRNVAFDDAECIACNFENVKLDGATFSGVRMTAANFDGLSSKIADDQLRALLSNCYACNLRQASLAGRDLSGAALIGVDFYNADLRGTRFDGAVLCSYVMQGALRQVKCDAMQGARVQGASFAGALICIDPAERSSCTPVPADTLRKESGSPLNGAAPP